jgi:hypothetical protein
MTDRQKAIVACWERWDEDEPDISTEQLMARVCTDCNCDAGHVAEALHQQQTETES